MTKRYGFAQLEVSRLVNSLWIRTSDADVFDSAVREVKEISGAKIRKIDIDAESGAAEVMYWDEFDLSGKRLPEKYKALHRVRDWLMGNGWMPIDLPNAGSGDQRWDFRMEY